MINLIIRSSFLKVAAVVVAIYFYIINFYDPHFIDGLIRESLYGNFCEAMYETIGNNHFIGWMTILLGLAVMSYSTFKVHYYRYFINFVVFSTALALWIAFDPYWIYPSLVGNGDFRWWLFAVCMPGPLYFVVSKANDLFRDDRDNTDPVNGSSRGFSNDDLRGEPDATLSSYAHIAAEKLNSTRSCSTSYALGIEGSWGSGKTTFMNILKETLPAGSVIMDYNPWLSLSENKLLQDFFESLAETASEHVDRELFSPVSIYGKALLALESESSIIGTLKNLINGYNEASLKSLKERISESLRRSRVKIFVFIDDIDRLDCDELFEVLRLIRNTADFPYIFYVTAYDKEYVVSQLKNKGIEKSDKYLEKIFNIEIGLPKTEDHQLEQELVGELHEMLPTDTDMENFPTSLIHGRLHSYRDVRRFARQFAINYLFMLDNIGLDEFNAREFFIIELLRYTDYATYMILKNDVGKYLEYKPVSEGLYQFSLNEKIQNELAGVPDILPLLRHLFESRRSNFKSICYLNNYRRYFSFRLEADDITAAEFESWMNAPDETAPEYLMNLVEKAGNRRKSVMFQFSTYNISHLPADKLMRYFGGLFDLLAGRYRRLKEIKPVITYKLRNDQNVIIDTDEFFDALRVKLNSIDNEPAIMKLSEIFKSLKSSDSGLGQRIVTLEADNFNRFLNIVSPDALDLIEHGSKLATIYRNSLEWTSSIYLNVYGEETESKSASTPLIDALCAYFSSHKSTQKSAFQEELTCYETCDESTGEFYLEYLPEEIAEQNIISVFGNMEYYNRFLMCAFE